MTFTLALDPLTALELRPVDLVDAALCSGLQTVSMIVQGSRRFPRTPNHDLIGDTAARRALRQKIDDAGVRVDTVEAFVIDRHCDPASFRPAFDSAVYLGATAVNTLAMDRDERRLADTYGRFCEMARAYGLSVMTEVHRTLAHNSIATAVAFAKACAVDIKIELDALHFFRAGGTFEDIALNRDWIGRAQLSDGPSHASDADYAIESLSRRRIPGDGELPLADFIRSLPRGIVIGVEVPGADLPTEQRIRRAVDAARSLVRIVT